MMYALYCHLADDVEKYQHKLVNELAKKFGTEITKTENIPAHFTLKGWFGTDNIKEIDKIIAAFCRRHKKTPVRVGGFGGFHPKVIYLDVRLSKEGKKTYSELISELRKVEWMTWDKFDAEKRRFHITLAEDCNGNFDTIRQFVKTRKRYFNCWFDNITVLELIGRHPLIRWKVHKTYSME
jgi:2'-5' RNA ligase